jgi:hypothetical protein
VAGKERGKVARDADAEGGRIEGLAVANREGGGERVDEGDLRQTSRRVGGEGGCATRGRGRELSAGRELLPAEFVDPGEQVGRGAGRLDVVERMQRIRRRLAFRRLADWREGGGGDDRPVRASARRLAQKASRSLSSLPACVRFRPAAGERLCAQGRAKGVLLAALEPCLAGLAQLSRRRRLWSNPRAGPKPGRRPTSRLAGRLLACGVDLRPFSSSA